MRSASLISRLLLAFVFTLSIFSTGRARAFASAQVCSEAFSRDAIPPVYSRGFVAESEKGFQFLPEKFGRAWAEMLKSVPDDVLVSLDEDPIRKLTLKPKAPNSRLKRIFVSAGLHGNEPLSSQTALDLLTTIMANQDLRSQVELVLLPTLNEFGLEQGTRASVDGTDPNREFGKSTDEQSDFIHSIRAAVGNQSFDLALDLHGAFRRTEFFVIKSGDDGGLAKRGLAILGERLLLHADDGKPTGAVGVNLRNGTRDPNRYQLEAPGISISTNQGTLKSHLYNLGTPYSYTVEYPGQLPIAEARAANLELVTSLVEEIVRGK